MRRLVGLQGGGGGCHGARSGVEGEIRGFGRRPWKRFSLAKNEKWVARLRAKHNMVGREEERLHLAMNQPKGTVGSGIE